MGAERMVADEGRGFAWAAGLIVWTWCALGIGVGVTGLVRVENERSNVGGTRLLEHLAFLSFFLLPWLLAAVAFGVVGITRRHARPRWRALLFALLISLGLVAHIAASSLRDWQDARLRYVLVCLIALVEAAGTAVLLFVPRQHDPAGNTAPHGG